MKVEAAANAALALSGIVKQYPGVRALDGVDLTVRPGEIHAVLGENGAGKSTLVGVAAGSVTPDEGRISLLGTSYPAMTPTVAREHGLALVYQTPALAPTLTISESMLVLLNESVRPSVAGAAEWSRKHFEKLGLRIDSRLRVADLTPREAHLVEIAAALANEPRVLVLDEPTEALGPDETEWLFGKVRSLVAAGGAVVYITHRMPEIREIADSMTVLRDGRVVGGGKVADFSDEQIIELIIGRSLETTFPGKPDLTGAETVFRFEKLTGTGFQDVDGSVRAGEIVGFAGVEGNGQRDVLRALAGLTRSQGAVYVAGKAVRLSGPSAAARHGIVFLSGDRLREAVFGDLGVRENIDALRLPDVSLARSVLVPRRERELVAPAAAALRIKAASLDTPVNTLSGGNQQKVLLARASLGAPKVLLVEDPTQGVDAGARLEIYRVLREIAARGTAVITLSTDAVELEGLCDRVLVFSRGRVRAELQAATLSEREITGAAVLSTEMSVEQPPPSHTRAGRPLLGGELQAAAMLALVVVVGGLTALSSPAFLSSLSLGQLFMATASLALVALAQLLVVMTGGIDMSVGSVVALSVVTVSFFAGGSPALFGVGVLCAAGAGAAIGLLNGLLVSKVAMPPVIATLVSSIGVLGLAQLLRPLPGGQAGDTLLSLLGTTLGGVPMVFVLAVVVGVLAHVVIRRTRAGRALRATGADALRAARMGVPTGRTRLLAYVIAGVLAACAGIAFYSQTGVGDASIGQSLTLTSVTAVVLGGASIFGGTGSALATLATALFLQTITSSLSFLSVSVAWQYWIQGILVIGAAVVPLVRTGDSRRKAGA
ncbi:ATP-binding cassette domain-containing protein [Streptosporangium lutulentum]|uniref:Ribose transport system ATP-binding protein n=1 Tax=Streptosporangium lutulentum TaxID=1461250 RepID=A0ABT9QAC2_9ACTN|nr:ATP-binding cassette domain-containing protein [Streptosporangium lutulentum]MDP9843019.1 ribose transport system ATP-binding protein [Streptosporangium lutulentum]